MKLSDLSGPRLAFAIAGVVALVLTGCHGNTDYEPLAEQKIYVSDRFYDVEILDADRAIVVGYKGKALVTSDAGMSWSALPIDTNNALYSLQFANKNVGWIVGQEAEILRTADGGKTWQTQGGNIYMGKDCRGPDADVEADECPLAPLFALSVVDAKTAIAIGDRSTVTMTKDGGKTWQTQTLTPEGLELLDLNSLLAFEDPVLYDVNFFDADNGFVVGEFGKIFKTTDGGGTWIEKQGSLVGGEYFDVLDLPTFFDIEFLNRKVGYVAGLEGRVAKTTDGGETWAWQDHGVKEYSAPFYSVAVLPNGAVWVVGAGGQLVTAPEGKAFGKGTLGTQVNNWIRTVEFNDNDNGWAVGGFGFIMNTKDGGKTWFRRIG